MACGCIVVFLMHLQGVVSQATVQKLAVEGLSSNVDILCDLDRRLQPFYWDIQGQIYELYAVPEIFTVRGHGALNIAAVDRRLNGWRFQCFSLYPTPDEVVKQGQITILTVVYDIAGTGPTDSTNLLLPSLRGLVMYYMDIKMEPNTTTLRWLYSPGSSSCVTSSFQVGIYTQSEINSIFSMDLMPINTFETTEPNITFTYNISGYIGISAIQTDNSYCATSMYLHSLPSDFNDIVVVVNGASASFDIPEDIRNNRSVQVIWSKDASTQCVCPPVEQLISQCACNIGNPNNVVTLSGFHAAVSNLTQQMGEGEVTLYFVSSVPSGCQGTCNLRAVAHRIIIIQVPPQPPSLSYSNGSRVFCFTIPDNLINREVYQVNLTDNTGSLTRLSDTYNSSQCLTITSDLYPDVCGPFQLSVAATMTHLVTELTLIPSGVANTPNPSDCYQAKENLGATSTTSATSASMLMETSADEESRNKSGQTLPQIIVGSVLGGVVIAVAAAVIIAVLWHCRKGKDNLDLLSQNTNTSSEETITIDSSKESDKKSSYNSKAPGVMQLNKELDSQNANNLSEETITIDLSKESDNSSYSYNAKASRLMQLNREHGTKPSTPLLEDKL